MPASGVPTLEKPLDIDIPVKMQNVKRVFSIGALHFEEDLPGSIFHMQLIENGVADWKAKSEEIAVFRTNAGHVTLHDAAFNAGRSVASRNSSPIAFRTFALRTRIRRDGTSRVWSIDSGRETELPLPRVELCNNHSC
jgi:hypothetical protein